MRKFLSLLLIIAFVMTSSMAFAFGGAAVDTNTTPSVQGGTSDTSNSISIFGYGDDTANAFGGSGGDAVNTGDAALYGWGKAKVRGSADLNGETHAVALATDLLPSLIYGQPTSFSAAAIATEVTVEASGYSKAYGLGLAKTSNSSEGTVNGQIDQNTYAAELTGGTSASAGQNSGASFSGSTADKDCDVMILYSKSASDIAMTGRAAAAGESFVTIDNKGHYQDAYAQTGNMATANVTGDDKERNAVYGSGQVGIDVMADHHGTSAGYAGGSSNFNYNSTTFNAANGSGSATMSGYVDAGNSTISVHAEGSANAQNF